MQCTSSYHQRTSNTATPTNPGLMISVVRQLVTNKKPARNGKIVALEKHGPCTWTPSLHANALFGELAFSFPTIWSKNLKVQTPNSGGNWLNQWLTAVRPLLSNPSSMMAKSTIRPVTSPSCWKTPLLPMLNLTMVEKVLLNWHRKPVQSFLPWNSSQRKFTEHCTILIHQRPMALMVFLQLFLKTVHLSLLQS